VVVKLPNKSLRSGDNGVRSFLIDKTPLGFIYSFFFKRNTYLRSFAIFAWKRVFPVGVVVLYPLFKSVRRLPLLNLSVSAERIDLVRDKEWVTSPPPQVFPVEVNDVVSRCALGGYNFPAIYIARLDCCKVWGGSTFVFAPDAIVCHDMFNAETDYTSEEVVGRMVIRPSSGLVYYFDTAPGQSAAEVIPEASVFTDAVSGNYAHFLTEVLPRIHAFVKDGPANVPLVLDSGLHPNIHMAIRLIAGGERELIELEVGESLEINILHVMSPCGYIPYERRPGTSHWDGHSDGVFSPGVLSSMRDTLRDLIPASETPIRNKVFIKRNSQYRNVTNSAEVEELLFENGFDVIEPEKLDFCEQVRIFSDAEIIIGATGAAFANLVFCKKDALVVIMISRHESMPYYYWQNMACAVGNSVNYVLGDIDAASINDIHSDFTIPLERVRHALGI
jgi:hypothetical protein